MKPVTKEEKVMGRPEKLTKELSDKLFTVICAGNYMETAAAFCGISKQSIYTWMKYGNEKKSQIYIDFLDGIEKAQAESEIRDLETIKEASKTQWQAAAWRLERRFYQKWGRKDNMNLGLSGTLNISEGIKKDIQDIFNIEIGKNE